MPHPRNFSEKLHRGWEYFENLYVKHMRKMQYKESC